MTITAAQLQHLANLACIDLSTENTPQLLQEVTAIMDFVEQLRHVDTTGVPPLSHPLDQHPDFHPHLRPDNITEKDCLAELATIAPVFNDNLYIVPQVIESTNT